MLGQVKALEGEVKKVKEHEEHYMYKVGMMKLLRFFGEQKIGAIVFTLCLQAKEWKNRCLKYERTLVSNKVLFKWKCVDL